MADVHIEEHSSPIKTPKQLAVVVLLSFLVPVLGIVLIVKLVTGGLRIDHSSPEMSEDAVAGRLKPVGEVNLVIGAAAPGSRSGEQVYAAACSACHAAGLLNSPKFGDAGAWKSRIAQGQKTLVQHAIQGIRQMPARGGNPDLTDIEVERAVVHMANKSGGNLKEPAAVAAASAPTAAATAPATPSAAAVAQAASGDNGEKTYNTVCQTCHAMGVAGAPKVGDKTAWTPRIAQGKETLYSSALKGKNLMPPKGGAMNLPDQDIKAAVDFMVGKAR